MSKKNFSIILIFTIFIAIIIGLTNSSEVQASTQTINGITWYYDVSNGEAVNVYVYYGTPGETLTIPEKLNNYPVTSLKMGPGNYNIVRQESAATAIKNIVIPNTVTTIQDFTFFSCTSLTSINIPESVTSIGERAFSQCYALKTVTFEENSNITTIGNYAFWGDSMLEEITFGENSNLTTIGNYAFSKCTKLAQIDKIPETLRTIGTSGFYQTALTEFIVEEDSQLSSIGQYAFYNCSKLKEVELPKNLQIIDAYTFQYCSVLEDVKLPENLQTIGNCAFQNCFLLQDLEFPDTLKTIGNYAFQACNTLSELEFPENLQTIGAYAFKSCIGLKGDLIIPDSVISIGMNAFEECRGLDGNLQIGSGITAIPSGAFYNCVNFYRPVIPSTVTSIGNQAFYGFTDIWIENTPDRLTVNESSISNSNKPVKIHWLNDTHNIKVSAAPGIKVIDADTGEEITTKDYECESAISYKIQVENGYNYDNLKEIIIKEGETNKEVISINTSDTYQIDRLLRDYELIIHNVHNDLDLSLRTFITHINKIEISDLPESAPLSYSRIPNVIIENGEIAYNHSKYPYVIETNDVITYKVRIYNESTIAGTAKKVNMYIPEGLEFIENDATNERYKWTKQSENKISTQYLADEYISETSGDAVLNYKDIEVNLKVTAQKKQNEDTRLVTIAEIEEESSEEADSIPASINSVASSDYKQTESFSSTQNTYIKGTEDDDDFENVILYGNKKVEYDLKIVKTDAITKELLSGAKFNLLDENKQILKTNITSNEGVLDFGTLTSYGLGEDIYYIQEVSKPSGYRSMQNYNVKLTVTKSLANKAQNRYMTNVACEITDYSVDTSSCKFIPIYNLEQLTKIGSEETITIDGVDYEFTANNNYKLMEDINVESIEWTPIDKPFTGVFDGNNHKIQNLKFSSYYNQKEVGMFRYISSGVIENLEFENVSLIETALNTGGDGFTYYYGTGVLAGVMSNGVIKNCKLSGSISSSSYDNVGGFIGHTTPGGLIYFQNCENNAEISSEYWNKNIGGFVGCALGRIKYDRMH